MLCSLFEYRKRNKNNIMNTFDPVNPFQYEASMQQRHASRSCYSRMNKQMLHKYKYMQFSNYQFNNENLFGREKKHNLLSYGDTENID